MKSPFNASVVARSVPYDNQETELDATSVQEAIDVLAAPFVGLQQTKARVAAGQLIYQEFHTLSSQTGEVLVRES